MSQQIKIGVEASTSQATNDIKQVDAAAEGLAGAIDHIGKATKAAADGMARMEAIAQRLKTVQNVLSKEFGKPIDAADATLFLHNFEKMRSNSIVNRRLKSYGSFEDWHAEHASGFSRQADAEKHRRFVLASGMRSTGFASQNGVPLYPPGPPPPPVPPPPKPPNPSPRDHSFDRARSSAMGFGRGMLALAGINSIASMATAGVDMGTERATGTDTLKRRMGDLGVSFDELQEQVAAAGSGMGMTYVESTRLAQQLARTVGNTSGFDVGGNLRTSIGLARAFGIDPAEATQFLGTMQRTGSMGIKSDGREFALLIAGAIEKGGYTAKADEVLHAIADFASQTARISLATPNIVDYASHLAGLTATGLPGLDPAGASNMLATADAAMRKGGAMGEASLNFSYAALSRSNPGINPYQAMALMEGGLFGSSNRMFGDGSAIERYFGKGSGLLPRGNGVNNLTSSMALMRQQYGTGWEFLSAMKGHFGLSSYAQAAAFASMKPADITAAGLLADRAGLKSSDIGASGMLGLARVAGADASGLRDIYGETMRRQDLSPEERSKLKAALGSGDDDTLRTALGGVVGSHNQEETEGSKTRATIADLKNELTDLGTDLLAPLNLIRAAVEKLANITHAAGAPGGGPEYWDSVDPFTGAPYSSTGGPPSVKRFSTGSLKSKLGLMNSASEYDSLFEEAGRRYGVDPQTLKAIGVTESDLNPGAVNGHAMGMMQLMPGTAGDMGVGDPMNARQNVMGGAAYFAMLLKKAGGNRALALQMYHGGPNGTLGAADVAYGQNVESLLAGSGPGSTPMPDGATAGGASPTNLNLGISGQSQVTIMDSRGAEVGQAVINHTVRSAPAGVSVGRPF